MDLEQELKNKAEEFDKINFKYPYQVVPEWIKYATDSQSQLTTGIPSFDKDLKYRLRGQLGAYIGRGGTKKSLLAQSSMQQNIRSNHAKGIYLSMEMSLVRLLDRIIDSSVVTPNSMIGRPSEALEYMARNNREEAHEYLTDQLKSVYGENMAIMGKPRMTSEDIDKAIFEYKRIHGDMDCMVVDGLSMMGGDSDEKTRLEFNTADLKAIANEQNIYISLIVHASRAAKYHFRDLREYIRGTEKILDNVDFIICLSMLVDQTEYSEGMTDIPYINDKMYAWFWNKRDTGNIIKKVADFNSKDFSIIERPEDVEIWECRSKKKGLSDGL